MEGVGDLEGYDRDPGSLGPLHNPFDRLSRTRDVGQLGRVQPRDYNRLAADQSLHPGSVRSDAGHRALGTGHLGHGLTPGAGDSNQSSLIVGSSPVKGG